MSNIIKTETIFFKDTQDEQKQINVIIRKINDLLTKADDMVKVKTKYNTLIYVYYPYEFWRSLLGERVRMSWLEYKTFSHLCYNIRQIHKLILNYFDVSETECNSYAQNEITGIQLITVLKKVLAAIFEHVSQLQIKCSELNEFYLEMVETEHTPVSKDLEPVSNFKKGTMWLQEIVNIYVKNGGTLPCMPDQLMIFLKNNIDKFSDEDFFTLIHLIEQNLGNVSFDSISNNLRNFVYFNWDELPKELQQSFLDISNICI